MDLVIDTNIIVSALITPSGTLSNIILKDLREDKLISPSFLIDELFDKYPKINKLTKLPDNELKEMIFLLLKLIN